MLTLVSPSADVDEDGAAAFSGLDSVDVLAPLVVVPQVLDLAHVVRASRKSGEKVARDDHALFMGRSGVGDNTWIGLACLPRGGEFDAVRELRRPEQAVEAGTAGTRPRSVIRLEPRPKLVDPIPLRDQFAREA